MERSQAAEYAIVAIPLILLGIFILYPVLTVLLRGILYGPGRTPFETLESARTQRVIGFTIFQALLSAVTSLVVGIPGAFILARLRFKGKSIIRAAMIVPFVLPPIVVVVGFLGMFGEYGILDLAIMSLMGSTESLINLASGFTGIIMAHIFYNVPLVVLMVSASLQRLRPELEESAELLGADRLQRFRHIFLPHIAPSLLASASLVFLFCFMSFPIILALGGAAYSTVEVEIYNSFTYFDYGRASTLAVIQLLVTVTIAWVYFRIGRAEKTTADKTSFTRTVAFSELSDLEKGATAVYSIALAVLISGPIFAIVHAAFYDPSAQVYTLSGIQNLLATGIGGGLVPLANSLFYAVIATLFAVVLGIPLAYAQRSRSKELAGLTSFMILLPLGISSITIAYGLMVAIAVPLGLSINPWPLIIIAQTIVGLPLSARSIEISLKDIDRNILDQADSLGSSRFQRLFFVELPLLAPGIMVGGVFAFAMAIGEMSATLFIALPQNITLAVAIYQHLGQPGQFVNAGAEALVLAIACFLAFLAIERISGESAGRAL
ncbi:iron ABC transporter permease [Candidatus Thorarchaeota archaeon]|nr:MAG: iron ABC transporter permease [Candidatus Thorarchaeota archaeon]